MEGKPSVVIRPVDDATRRLWSLVLSLAVEFGADGDWSLIGGLMVQLHGFERDDDPRPSADIDLLGGARRRPQMTEKMATRLVELGAGIADPPRSDPRLGYRFEYEARSSSCSAPTGCAPTLRRPQG